MSSIRIKLGIVVAALAAVSLVAGACAGDDGGDEGTATVATKTAASGATTAAANNGSSNQQGEEVVVSMTENKFTPNKLSVKAGVPVTFVAKNEGQAVHNMKVLTAKTEGKDYSSELMVSPGKESKFTVTFSKTGTVNFQCDYHLPDMVGTIEVK